MDLDQVERARHGDVAAYEALVRARFERVIRLAVAIVIDEADASDVAQEVFVVVWRQLPGLRDPAQFDAWLTRITVNQARMALRSKRRRRVREIPVGSEFMGAAPGFAVADDRSRDARRLAAALETLDADQRSLLALHHLEGRDVADLARTLGIPAGTVKSRLFAARRALREALHSEPEP